MLCHPVSLLIFAAPVAMRQHWNVWLLLVEAFMCNSTDHAEHVSRCLTWNHICTIIVM